MLTKYQKNIKLLWNFCQIQDRPIESDVIILLGMRDLGIANLGATLIKQKKANYIICTGNSGRCSQGILHKPEAHIYQKILQKHNIPEHQILIEDKSTNMGENFEFSKQIIINNKIKADKFIIIQSPFLQKRAKLTFEKFFPNKKSFIYYYLNSFDTYENKLLSQHEIVHFLVGEIHRLTKYPELGFFKKIEIPKPVRNSAQILANAGFNKYL